MVRAGLGSGLWGRASGGASPIIPASVLGASVQGQHRALQDSVKNDNKS